MPLPYAYMFVDDFTHLLTFDIVHRKFNTIKLKFINLFQFLVFAKIKHIKKIFKIAFKK